MAVRVRWVAALVVLLLALGAVVALPSAPAAAQESDTHVLVFSKTAGFRHASIPDGIAAVEQLGVDNGWQVDATEDASQFTDENLAQYDAVVWLSTTGDVLDADQQAAFERYVQGGGGYVGIHAAADTEYDWAWYGGLVGAYFDSHPANQDATVDVLDTAHPSTDHLPREWGRFDEWYNYQSNPRGDVHVLASVDEGTYSGGNMGDDHPIAWCQDYDGGRSWYTGGGHTSASFYEPDFVAHIEGGIETAAGLVPADCGGTVWDNFETVTLAQGEAQVGEPIGMAVLPDGRVLHTSRDGTVYLTDPGAGTTTVAATIPVYSHDEDGLQNIALSPDFADDGWVYVYYAPTLDTPAGDAPTTGTGPETFAPYEGANYLSRFQLVGGELDLASEQVLLEVDQDRGICCHNGGDIDFDAAGNLYLSTGDDTNPFESSGYTPIDERLTRNPAFDAQRSAGNTDDLRGKILRIHPEADGSYTIPDGNLFPAGTANTRPEIFVMGLRNPFRISVDPQTGAVLWGDYGPDAGSADPDRGPKGLVEWNMTTVPENSGWPFCTADDKAYIDYDFATGTSGDAFDCAGGPVNDSPRNDGVTDLPSATPADLWYGDNESEQPWTEFGSGGQGPMGGPIYRYDPALDSDTKFPEYYDGVAFFYEWTRDYIKNFHLLDDEGTTHDITPFLPTQSYSSPMDMEFGPDGSLYVLEYGTGFFGGSPASELVRIDYVKGTRAPIAEVSAVPTSGTAPLEVSFSSAGTRDPDVGASLSYAWDFTADGTVDSTEPDPTYTYTEVGTYNAVLTVTDETGKTGTASVTITVGNTAPEVTLAVPVDGGFFEFGDQVPFEVSVTDAEDSEIDCSRVEVTYVLGHDEHGHPLSSATGCEGTISTPRDDGHPLSEELFGLINATYTDSGGQPGAGTLSGDDEAILNPKLLQAEHFDSDSGVQVVDDAGANGGARVGYVDDGDWIAFDPVNLRGIDDVTVTGASGGSGGTVEFRFGAPDGELLGSVDIPNTGGYGSFQEFGPITLGDPGGTDALYLVFTGSGGGLFDLDQLQFSGVGVAGNARPVVSVTATPDRGEAPLEVAFDGEATDAEGDPLSYEWDFGVAGAPNPTTEDATYTYTDPGSYTASLTVTDPNSGSRTATADVTVLSEPLACPTPGSDEFDGSSLDTSRWDVVRDDPSQYAVADGALTIDTTATDMFGGSTDGANLILQPTPEGIWRAETKVTIDAAQNYQQAGLIVYGDDGDFAKLDLLHVDAGRKFEFVLNQDGSPRNAPQDSTAILPESFPDKVLLRIDSNGEALTAYRSVDGIEWTQVGRPAPLDGIPSPRVGVFALHALDGTPSTPAVFDRFVLVGPGDDFSGDTLVRCRWTEIVREAPDGYAVADGALHIETGDGTDMYGGNTNAENIVLQPAPNGGWEATTKVSIALGEKTYEQASLMVYGSDDDFAKLSFIKVPDGRNLEFILQQDGSPVDGGAADRTPLLPQDFPDTVWLRVTSDGTSLSASYSSDGETFVDFGRSRSLDAIPDPRIGLAAFNGDGDEDAAHFDEFTLVPAQTSDQGDLCTTAAEPDEGFRMLFDGTAASLQDWSQAGPGGFTLTDDCTIETFGGLGLFWYSAEQFDSPHTLKLDWMIPGDENSGVFVGFPAPGDDPFVAVEQGYEIQIDPTDDADSVTGAIYNIQAPDQDVVDQVINPPGEWNTFEITVADPRIVVELNGEVINDFTSTDLARDLSQGHIGLQNHGPGDTVFFRDVQIAEDVDVGLTCDDPDDDPGVDDEFDGTDLDGCRWDRTVRYDPSTIEVSDGSLRIQTSDADIYQGSNTGPTNLVLQDAPDGDWTIETKVTFDPVTCCQQAGLMTYTDDDTYVKVDLIANADGSNRVELRSEIDAEIQEPTPDLNDWPTSPDDTYWLRLVKSGEQYSASISNDGESWTDLPEAVPNGALADFAVGVFALGVFQETPVTAAFDWFRLVQDTTAPTVTAALDPAEPDGQDGWYVSPVEVVLSADDGDGSGIAAVEYALDGGGWTVYEGPFEVSADGVHEVVFRASDVAGNVSEPGSVTFRIDATAPEVAASLDPPEPNGDPVGEFEGTYNTPVTVAVEASDATSGLSVVEVSVDGGEWSVYDGPVTVSSEGSHTVAFRASDVAGNTAEGEVSFEILEDACPGSELSETVVVGDIDSGVDNAHQPDGCTISDLIADDEEWASHGQFMQHVSSVTNQLRRDGVITGREKGQITRAAARSDVGRG